MASIVGAVVHTVQAFGVAAGGLIVLNAVATIVCHAMVKLVFLF